MSVAADSQQLTPASAQEAAAALRDTPAVRIRGGATKLGWGHPIDVPVHLSTARLDAIVEHHEGDLTAVLQAGVPLAAAQEAFARAGQRLMFDPPGAGATVGGIVATGDSGPLRHRYGPPRDLVLGTQVALADGTVARAGSKVIKNVAGYDLAKLMAGGFGTLGVLTEVTVRLHPRPAGWCTAIGRSDDPRALAAAAAELAHLPLEAEALDLRWDDGAGAVLARFGGSSAPDRAQVAAAALEQRRLAAETTTDDEPSWTAQREAQRGAAVLRISTTQDRLAAVLAAARAEPGATAVARAAHGLAWIALPEAPDEELGASIARLRAAVAPAVCVLLDAPAPVRAAADPWGPAEPGRLALMRRVKERFDPDGHCNPGLFVGGI